VRRILLFPLLYSNIPLSLARCHRDRGRAPGRRKGGKRGGKKELRGVEKDERIVSLILLFALRLDVLAQSVQKKKKRDTCMYTRRVRLRWERSIYLIYLYTLATRILRKGGGEKRGNFLRKSTNANCPPLQLLTFKYCTSVRRQERLARREKGKKCWEKKSSVAVKVHPTLGSLRSQAGNPPVSWNA